VRQHVVPEQQVGLAVLFPDQCRSVLAEEGDLRPHALAMRKPRDVGRRLDAQYGNIRRDEVLQQVSVVAGDLGDEAPCMQAEAFRHGGGVTPGMVHPAVRIRRQVRVFREDVGRGDKLFQLHQEAVIADVGVERVEGLHLVQLLWCDVRLAQRGHAQIDERGRQRFATEAAARPVGIAGEGG